MAGWVTVSTDDAVPIGPLTEWLHANVAGSHGAVHVEQLSGGSSNLTFRVRDDVHDLVLRRPPLGRVLATANDVLREHRVQHALAATDVPVAAMLGACADVSVIGAPFYVMSMLDGVVYTDAEAVAHLTEADARAASYELVDVLVRLHAVDPSAVGLADLGRPDGFLERQVRRWRTQWETSKQHDCPEIEEVADRLSRAVPAGAHTGIVHGDYSFNNTIWERHRPAVMQAVLDWEMATLGDPLTDLGMLVTYWGPVGERLWRARAPQPHRANAGFPSADALVEWYARASSRPLDDIDFYRVLATFKLAVISEGALARIVERAPERAASTRAVVEELAAAALDQAERSSDPALNGRARAKEAYQR